eukprot:9648879-Alexandrium_andersonii.AAC.1
MPCEIGERSTPPRLRARASPLLWRWLREAPGCLGGQGVARARQQELNSSRALVATGNTKQPLAGILHVAASNLLRSGGLWSPRGSQATTTVGRGQRHGDQDMQTFEGVKARQARL